MSETKNLIKAWGNNDKRQAFLKAYKEWGVWFTTPELDLTFYRYQLPDKTVIIAMEHKYQTYINYKEGYKWEDGGIRYYVQKDGDPFSPNSHSSIGTVAELLKNAKTSLQKEEKKQTEEKDPEDS